jgi:hypothetical protein
MLAPVSIRRLTLCFSVLSKIRSSSALMMVTGACMGGSGTCHWVGGSGFDSPGNQTQCAFQCFPWQMGQGPGGSFLWGHCLLKWPACPHWKHVLRFGLCPGKTLWAQQSEPPAIYPFSFPSQGLSFLFLSPYYIIQMWLHEPTGLDLCSPQPPVFEDSYGYLVLTVLEIYLLGWFPLPVTLV